MNVPETARTVRAIANKVSATNIGEPVKEASDFFLLVAKSKIT